MHLVRFWFLWLMALPALAQQPNILWISAEDLSPRLACYGDSTVATPHLDRLAREGVVYDRVFTTAGVCAPSRNAIITGNYQIRTGGHNMRTLFDTNPAKTGLPKEYYAVPPANVRCFPEYLRQVGYYATNNDKTDYQFIAPPTVWDESGPKATWRNRAPGQPFFAVVNLTHTHESQVWARKNNPLRVDPAKVKLPPYYPDNAVVRQDVARFYSNIGEMDDEVGQILQQLETDGLLDNTIIFFWTDHGDGLPFYKREVYHRGLHVPLIVRYPDRRLAGTRDATMISAIDLGPTVLSLAGLATPQQMDGQAFLGRFAKAQGRQLIFAARDRLDSEYDRVRSVYDGRLQYVRNFQPELPRYMDIAYRKQQPLMAELLRLRAESQLTGDQLFWFQPTKPAEELYDLAADPYQLRNLAGQPGYQTDLARLRKVMDRWLADTKDQGAIAEKELVRQMWNGQTTIPTTAAPTATEKNGQVRLDCATEGASLGYRAKGATRWEVYTKPFAKPPGGLEVVAMRIGYQASPIVQVK
jgi:N-sulfoglucosamine sulfohydrolase